MAVTTSRVSTLALPENYIYISHLDEDYQYWFLPTSPDMITDSMGSNFQSTNALGRSAPVYSYSYSGPRTVQVSIEMHRDLMNDINIDNTSVNKLVQEDYVENLLRALQSIVVPKYNKLSGAPEPPMVAVRFGKQIFIKGIVNGDIGVTYGKPILYNDKYAQIKLSFTVTEVDPYDANAVFANGSFRGVVSTLKSGMNMEDID